jgi:hypothetical protein
VAVRACGIAKPVARYFERLRSHDLAFRVLARMRVTFYRKLEPLIPDGRMDSAGRAPCRRGRGRGCDAEPLPCAGSVRPRRSGDRVVAVALAAAVLPGAALVLAAG